MKRTAKYLSSHIKWKCATRNINTAWALRETSWKIVLRPAIHFERFAAYSAVSFKHSALATNFDNTILISTAAPLWAISSSAIVSFCICLEIMPKLSLCSSSTETVSIEAGLVTTEPVVSPPSTISSSSTPDTGARVATSFTVCCKRFHGAMSARIWFIQTSSCSTEFGDNFNPNISTHSTT